MQSYRHSGKELKCNFIKEIAIVPARMMGEFQIASLSYFKVKTHSQLKFLVYCIYCQHTIK